MRIVVSGATGFIGSALVNFLKSQGHDVVPLTRDDLAGASLVAKMVGSEAVVHLAGLAHSKRASSDDFEFINHRLSFSMAEAANAAGVSRFIFVSTINVVAGNRGVLSPRSPVCPTSAYGESKAKAEQMLLTFRRLDTIILRPPLVYGAFPKGSLAALTRLCLTGIPLPFGLVNNRRSMASVTNVTGAVEFLCTTGREKVAGRIFHVADERDFSLRDIVRTIRNAVNMPVRLLPVPVPILRTGATLIAGSHFAAQLFDDLRVDFSDLVSAGWAPIRNGERDLIDMARTCQN